MYVNIKRKQQRKFKEVQEKPTFRFLPKKCHLCIMVTTYWSQFLEYYGKKKQL